MKQANNSFLTNNIDSQADLSTVPSLSIARAEAMKLDFEEEVSKETDGMILFLTPSSKTIRIQLRDEEESEEEVASPELDPWALPEIITGADDGKKWTDMSCMERTEMLLRVLAKLAVLMALLYLFICSLNLMSNGFRLLGGRAAGEVFRNSQLLQNPICGLMIGVLATVLLQSSSTSTSIVVSMVAADILDVQTAIPIVMGANIGTSMTNTLVSVAHSSRRAEFRRAFAGATVHDMFNWLCVIILLPLEVATGYLYRMTDIIVKSMHLQGKHKKPPKLLKVLTEPFTRLIVQLDKSKIKKVALGEVAEGESFSLIKRDCGAGTSLKNVSEIDAGNLTGSPGLSESVPCKHLFATTSLGDTAVGLILLLVSLVALIVCLICVVKLLNSMLRGQIAAAIRKTINNDLPGCFGFLTGYLAILIGAILTILVQSSSVFTSTLTPLVGIGVLSLERMYPLTLGANVGTTFTSVLAALASPPNRLSSALQISLCHLLFNVTGILIFFPVPFMRKVPITLAKLMGNKTAKYRWFAVLYIALMFFLLPGMIFGLSMAGPFVMMAVGLPVACTVFVVVVVSVLQRKYPKCLPEFLRTWQFLPKWMHSLEPFDRGLSCVGGLLQSLCPFCSSGWGSCFTEVDTAPQSASRPDRTESRKQLLLATSPANSANPSRFASRSNSPTRPPRFRKTTL